MTNKKVIMLTIIIVSLLTLSAVSAAENATDDIVEVSNDTDNSEIIQEAEPNGVKDDSFQALQSWIDSSAPNSTLTLDKDYEFYDGEWYDRDYSSIEIDNDLTIDGAGHTVNAKNYDNVFIVKSGTLVLKNLHIINGKDAYMSGGGVNVEEGGSCTAIGCTFENNTARWGGAMYGGDAINCTFTSNYADNEGSYGGAMYGGTAINCVFIGNKVIHWQTGGYGGAMYEGTAINCVFINNTADNYGGAMCGGIADSCIFVNNDCDSTNILQPAFNVSDFISTCGSGDKFIFNLTANSTGYRILNRNINVTLYDVNNVMLSSFNCPSDCWIVELPIGFYKVVCRATDYGDLGSCNATLNISQGVSPMQIIPINASVKYPGDILFKIVFPKMVTGNLTVSINGINSTFDVSQKGHFEGDNLVILLTKDDRPIGQYNLTATYSGDGNFNGQTANATSYVYPVKVELNATAEQVLDVGNTTKIVYSITPDDLNGVLTFKSSNTAVARVDSNGTITAIGGGTAIITVSYYVNENYTSPKVEIKITVNKFGTQIMANAVSTIYNIKKNLVITLKDGSGVIIGRQVTVKVGTISKTLKTNSKGQVSVDISSLVPKAYTAIIKFAGDTIYKASSNSVKVTVKKSNSKLVATSKAFNLNSKTKKVTAILKDAKNRIIKNRYVTFKVAGKSYKVKTNSKGVATATVKIAKKGSFATSITFAGDKYYNKCSKAIKVTVK